MAGMAPEGSQFDAKHCDPKMQLLSTGETEFTSYEVYEVFYFDDKGLQENLLRGIYAYGFEKPSAIQHRGIVPSSESKGLDVMAGMAPEGSQLDAKDYDSQMRELLANSEEFTSYDEVCRSFDDMAIQENLLRGIYVYGNSMDTGAAAAALGKGKKKAEGKKGKEHTRRSCSPTTT